MIIAIDNGCSYSDHTIFFVDLDTQAGHQYTLKDVQELLPALNKDNINGSVYKILFTGEKIEFRVPGATCSFSAFVYTSMRMYDENKNMELYINLQDVSVDLSERLKADLLVEHRKFYATKSYKQDLTLRE